LSKPSDELKHIWAESVEAQALSASLLKPGANPSDILNANNEYLTARGYPPETRLYAHGQGYDLIERPALQPDETMTIQENMLIAVHPRIVVPTAQAYCCDNFLSTKEGGIRLHKTPLELIEV
jgi:Xaa-Pro aminopeptidase